jgi:hypothetical protein
MRLTMLLPLAAALVAPTIARGDEPAASDRVFNALAGDPACHLETMDEDPSPVASRARIVALYRCAGTNGLALLAAGPYPVPNRATPASYRVLDRRAFVVTGPATATIARGACAKGRRAITTSAVIVADWAGRSAITGKRIAQFWTVSPDRQKLVRLNTAGMTCRQDEP